MSAINAIIPATDQAVYTPPRYGLVPSSMSEAMKLAEMMAGAKLVPAALQKSPADCLMVIQQAIRWDMDPFAVAQECSVIQGKLMHSGKLVAAVVNARGQLTQRLSFEYKGTGDHRTITVSGQLQGEPSPRVVEVILQNAKTANVMWQKQPDQQLMYHGVRVWARRHTPELMLGVYSPEEFDEPQPRQPPRAAANVMLPLHDPSTGEIIDDTASQQPKETVPAKASAPSRAGTLESGADTNQDWPEYVERWNGILDDATDAKDLGAMWNSTAQKQARKDMNPPPTSLNALMTRVGNKIAELKGTVPA